jgi:bifunctional isochorismate lyase/aryl carrier protein
MSSGHPNYQEMDFYADIAAILRTTPQSLVELDSPQDAGLDSVRLLILSEKWQQRGITVSFLELAERQSFAAWWRLISERTRGLECERP